MPKYFTGSQTIACGVGPIFGRMVVKRRESDGNLWYSVYSMADATAGTFANRLAHVQHPVLFSPPPPLQEDSHASVQDPNWPNDPTKKIRYVAQAALVARWRPAISLALPEAA